MNELVVVIQVLLFYGGLVGMYRCFGSRGVLAWMVLATISANIECLIQINAFGMRMTGGNILFASTFLATDIVSEMYGKRMANRYVNLSIATSVLFVLVSQSWLFFKPNSVDFVFPHVQGIFNSVPRIMIASLLTFAIVQKVDIWLYHYVWRLTTKRLSDRSRFLWLRNNTATLIAQFFNSVLFNFGAFYLMTPKYSARYCLSISMATFAIYVVTSIIDTPFIYLARRMTKSSPA